MLTQEQLNFDKEKSYFVPKKLKRIMMYIQGWSCSTPNYQQSTTKLVV